ncbi:MAG: BolA family transcriptional regulator [Candidatus Kinetoplastibacterium crithidii]|nr:MAG: BolA family transcriptional regulator [Candidatus Kinetoplastibacterium crithidii]
MKEQNENTLVCLIKNRLAVLQPIFLEVIDLSDLHKNHNKPENSGHYKVIIKSDKFINLSKIEQHRTVYKCLDGLIPSPIHAIILEIRN